MDHLDGIGFDELITAAENTIDDLSSTANHVISIEQDMEIAIGEVNTKAPVWSCDSKVARQAVARAVDMADFARTTEISCINDLLEDIRAAVDNLQYAIERAQATRRLLEENRDEAEDAVQILGLCNIDK